VPEGPTSLRVGNTGFVIPFVPGVRSAMLPSKTMVAAVTTAYRLIADRPDGTRLVIERPVSPVPMDDGEWEWRRRALIASARRHDPGFVWDGDEMPRERGHISSIFGDRSNRIWVLRVVQVNRVPECTDDPLDEADELVVDCYENVYGADVFDEATGKLLGEVAFPDGVSLSHLFVVGDKLYATTQDEAGTIMVKRYRLVLPGEAGQ